MPDSLGLNATGLEIPSVSGIHTSRITIRRSEPTPRRRDRGDESERDQGQRKRGARKRTPRYVLYWMQQSQRAVGNHALEYAVACANQVELPLLVCFGLTDSYPDANARHYRFLLDGLAETGRRLTDRGIGFVVRRCGKEGGVSRERSPRKPSVDGPHSIAIELSADASVLIVDTGYLVFQRKWRNELADSVECPVIEVESDVVVPVLTVSDKEEYAAATIRRKIYRRLNDFLCRLEEVSINHRFDDDGVRGPDGSIDGEDWSDPSGLLEKLDLDRSVSPVDSVVGGTSAAFERLQTFIEKKLPEYGESRNDPSLDFQSGLSAYLHFGQISVVDIALAVLRDEAAQDRFGVGADTGETPLSRLSESAQSFLEELIVRRELSMNFVTFNHSYDSPDCLPDWAKKTIADHAADERPVLYELDTLESAETHDPYWNAAQKEMIYFGAMKGYMRMYWGKKIIEWSPEVSEAYRRMIYLNNKYFLDGRDPNGYTGIAWCFGKHDRPWQEREIFGKLRYMNARGLERKFDIASYVYNVDTATS